MNKRHIKDLIYAVEKTMGGLRQITLRRGNTSFALKTDYSFSAEAETISCWQDYGQYNEDRLHLLWEGEEKPIIIDEVEFWPIVKDIFYFQLSTSAHNFHRVTLNGKMSDGKIFEEEYTIKGDDILPEIIYLMILISKTGDPILTKDMWNAMTRDLSLSYQTVGEHLDKVAQVKKLSEDILPEYPFMASFFQMGLPTIVERLKKSLEPLAILK